MYQKEKVKKYNLNTEHVTVTYHRYISYQLDPI